MSGIENGRTIGELSWAGQQLDKRLRAAAVGEMITYRSLSELIERDVQHQAPHLLRASRERLMRDERLVFDVIENVGLKRLADEEIVQSDDSCLRIRKAARRGARRQACVDHDKLPPALKAMHLRQQSMSALFDHFTRPGRVAALERRHSQTLERLPLDKTIEHFKK